MSSIFFLLNCAFPWLIVKSGIPKLGELSKKACQYSIRFPIALPMFRSAVGKVIRLGAQASKRMSSTLTLASPSRSNVGYALALGAFGAASVFMIRKHLNAQEKEGGYLYTWYCFRAVW